MGIIDNIKDAANIARQIDNIELYRKILDLQQEAMDLQEQAFEKTKRIKELEEALSFKGTLVFMDGVYFEKNGEGKPKGVPYCPRCHEVEKQACHLNAYHSNVSTGMQCPNCKTFFRVQPK